MDVNSNLEFIIKNLENIDLDSLNILEFSHLDIDKLLELIDDPRKYTDWSASSLWEGTTELLAYLV